MLQLATKADKVITQFNIVISGKFGTAVMMTDWSSILLSSKSTAIVVAGPVWAIRVEAVALQQGSCMLTLWQFTQQTALRRQLDVPRVADVPQQNVADGAMHEAVPVNAVICAIACLTTERVVQVHNVKAVIWGNLQLTSAAY